MLRCLSCFRLSAVKEQEGVILDDADVVEAPSSFKRREIDAAQSSPGSSLTCQKAPQEESCIPEDYNEEVQILALRKQETILRMLLDLLHQQPEPKEQSIGLSLRHDGDIILMEEEAALNVLLSSSSPLDSSVICEALLKMERRMSGALASSPNAPSLPLNVASMCQVYASLILSQSKSAKGSITTTNDVKDNPLLGLLARPEILDLIASAMSRLKDSSDKEKRAAMATMCSFVVDLVKFVGRRASSIGQQKLMECALTLRERFISPSAAAVLPGLVKLEAESLTDSLAIYYHSLRLANLLFESPAPILSILLSDEVAAHYSAAIYKSMSVLYQASRGDPTSACAELCRIHVSTLRSLVRGSQQGSKNVGMLDLLLSEVSVHFEAQSAENEEEGEEMEDEEEYEVRGSPSPESKQRVKKQSEHFQETGKFEFSYDLNEDLERILDLEDHLGANVDLEGFEYDEEGQRLLDKAASQAAVAPVSGVTSYDSADEALSSSCGHSPLATDRSRPVIPKLSFSSVSRSALSSSLRPFSLISQSPSNLRRSAIAPVASDESLPPKATSQGLVPTLRIPSQGLVPNLRIPSRMSRESEGAPLGLSTPLNPSPPNTLRLEAKDSFKERPPSVRLSPLHMQLYQSVASQVVSPRGAPDGPPLLLPPRPPLTDRGQDHSPSSVRFRTSAIIDGAEPSIKGHEEEEEGQGHGLSPHPPSSPPSSGSTRLVPTSIDCKPSLPPMAKLHLVPSLDLSHLAATTARSAHAAAPSSHDGINGTHRLQRRSALMSISSNQPSLIALEACDREGELVPGRKIGGRKAPLDSAADKSSVGGSPGHGAASRSQFPHIGKKEGQEDSPGSSLLSSNNLIHMGLLRLAFDALLTRQGTLEPTFWSQFPLDTGFSFNLEYLLLWHLSSGPGAGLVKELEGKLSSLSPPQVKAASLRLLRLLSRGLFDESRFSELKFQARGAFGNIFRAKDSHPSPSLASSNAQVIIKTIDLPSGPYERCVLPDVFGEISIMERYKGLPSICQLIDYGISSSGESYWIVMKRYRCSLSEWRLKQPKGFASTRIALYLSVVDQIVDTLLVLSKDSVVHFDLKGSNVLIDPNPGVKDSELWSSHAPSSGSALNPPFQAVLADFGEARSYRNAEEAFTVRNRGTEVYKSPEMLLLNNKEVTVPTGSIQSTVNSSQLNGAGLASDIWSLGCLMYELLSGQILFGADYASVTHRVAFGGPGNLKLTEEEKEGLGWQASLIDLIEWILERAPDKRPTLGQIKLSVRNIRQELLRNE